MTTPPAEPTPSLQRPIAESSAKGYRDAWAFLFDLDGTLVDSVYQHVLAWKEALDSVSVQ